MNRQGRPTTPGVGSAETHATFTGNRAILQEEALLFELGRADATGVDFDEPEPFIARLGTLERTGDIGLPGLSEPEAVRHYVRLSQRNFSIDTGPVPLGSCTMKHNPRLNERMARLPGFADVHPLQPVSTVPGALALMQELAAWLMEITGMPAISLSPRAGAHGELCGMAAIKSAIAAKGEAATRKVVLVPDSAHGTNPATAAMVGMPVRAVPVRADGTVDPAEVAKLVGPDIAALMITNPNTCGLFERDIAEIARIVHEAGAYIYCDGANLNAIMGRARPGDLGIDAMQINLHKTFSTPHGGGGPGSGPVVLSARVSAFAPLPLLRTGADGVELVEVGADADEARPFGRLSAFHGQMGMFVRALTYMLSHGGDGLAQASDDAVLAANYIRVGLADLMSLPFGNRLCMQEVLFDDAWLKDSGVTTLDFAKAMIDEGYHPMTMYFPLVVHGAMLIEPTESESKASLDLFVATLRDLALAARAGDSERFTGAPYYAPRRRLDETRAARQPVLRWTPPAPIAEAAE
ncbi:putative glycine dehydrogenase (decarboxylating) subunit 2 [Chelatococcus reniformis]|uniref:glycine dehydrogenase (aminomethyl-transferring) n=1 Tax=Chelatococcus reniformis TaxID=1494448 RepID=A0A916U6R1_9HYPH|nr:putative glycine dehydrogenase (decarboxylating) subunit 2 [Chelatococcus reniformis]